MAAEWGGSLGHGSITAGVHGSPVPSSSLSLHHSFPTGSWLGASPVPCPQVYPFACNVNLNIIQALIQDARKGKLGVQMGSACSCTSPWQSAPGSLASCQQTDGSLRRRVCLCVCRREDGIASVTCCSHRRAAGLQDSREGTWQGRGQLPFPAKSQPTGRAVGILEKTCQGHRTPLSHICSYHVLLSFQKGLATVDKITIG